VGGGGGLIQISTSADATHSLLRVISSLPFAGNPG
jgi:hypothetical protein